MQLRREVRMAAASGARPRLQQEIRDLHPGYFALVMATGIVSVAVGEAGAVHLSAFMLGLTIACYLLLVVAYGWRLGRYRAQFLADAVNPAKTFAFFSFVAGSDVLASRLAGDGQDAWTAALLIVSAAAWLLLSYGIPLRLVTRRGARSALADVNGTWFLWTVGTQSIAVVMTTFPPPLAARLAPAAVGLWAVGVLLYLLVAGLVLAALLHFPAEPARLDPAYWVFMGATAISVLAGAQILGVHVSPFVAASHAVVAGVSVIFWAFGTWLIPLLICLGAWRHLVRRVPLGYEPSVWSMVFPLGMYSVASRALGTALKVPWLVYVGRVGTWIAFGFWALVFAAMLVSLAGLPLSVTRQRPAGGIRSLPGPRLGGGGRPGR